MKRHSFKLTPAVAFEHSCGVLALDPHALNHSFSLPPNGHDEDIETEIEDTGDVVGVVEIHGPLTQRAVSHMCGYSDGYDAIASRFEAAMCDEEVSRVVLLIDSPGGDCAGLFECVERMRAIKAAFPDKRVDAFAEEMAASAAYALATVADAIYLPRSGQLGSIGCVGIHVDETEAAKKAGLQFTVFRNPARKFEGNSIEPLTEEAAEAIQDRIDVLAAQFFELVAASRGLSVSAVRSLEGAMFSGPSAVKVGLADGLETKENVMSGKAKKPATRTAKAPKAKAEAKANATPSAVMPKAEEADSDEMKKMQAENAELKAKLAKYEAEEPEEEEEEGDEDEDEEDAEDAEAEEGDDEDEDEEDDEEAPPSSKPAAAPKPAKSKASARIADLKAKLAESKVSAVLNQASRDGKLTPADRKAWRSFAKVHGLKALKAELAAMPQHQAATGSATPKATPKTALSATDRAVAEQLGLTDEQFANGKADAMAPKEISR